MGTSADRSSGSGGAWTPLKHAANSYVRGIGTASSSDRARRVLARHVPLLGGVGGATSSAHAGSTGIQRLGELLSGLGSAGLDQALESMGLGSLVGQDRFAILDELVTFIAGDGDVDLGSRAHRDRSGIGGHVHRCDHDGYFDERLIRATTATERERAGLGR